MPLCRCLQLRLSQRRGPRLGHPAAKKSSGHAFGLAESRRTTDAQASDAIRDPELGIDSTFLKKHNKLLDMNAKCATCGTKIELFVNAMSAAGEVWPFCEKCGGYVDVVPSS